MSTKQRMALILGLGSEEVALFRPQLEAGGFQVELAKDAKAIRPADVLVADESFAAALNSHASRYEATVWVLCTSKVAFDPEYAHLVLRRPMTKDAVTDAVALVTENPILDVGVLQSIQDLAGDDDPGFLGGLIEIFTKRGPEMVAEMQEGLATKDDHKLERSAHALKGSCGNLGVKALARLCERMETCGREHELDAAPSLIKKIEYGYQQAKSLLESQWVLPKAG